MQMMDNVMKEPPKFLDGKPNDLDKVTWKRAYATYVIETKKTPEEIAKETLILSELLPILGSLDRKWKFVDPEMMVTTHTMVHRLKTIL